MIFNDIQALTPYVEPLIVKAIDNQFAPGQAVCAELDITTAASTD